MRIDGGDEPTPYRSFPSAAKEAEAEKTESSLDLNLTPSSVIFENIFSVGLRMINALIIKDRVVKYQLFYKDKSTIMTNISESYRQCRKKDKRTEESKITTADNLKNRIENSSFDEGKFFKFFKIF